MFRRRIKAGVHTVDNNLLRGLCILQKAKSPVRCLARLSGMELTTTVVRCMYSTRFASLLRRCTCAKWALK